MGQADVSIDAWRPRGPIFDTSTAPKQLKSHVSHTNHVSLLTFDTSLLLVSTVSKDTCLSFDTCFLLLFSMWIIRRMPHVAHVSHA